MKWTGISFGAALITWFRVPRRERRTTVMAAFMAMLVVAVGVAVIVGLIALMSLAMPDRP